MTDRLHKSVLEPGSTLTANVTHLTFHRQHEDYIPVHLMDVSITTGDRAMIIKATSDIVAEFVLITAAFFVRNAIVLVALATLFWTALANYL